MFYSYDSCVKSVKDFNKDFEKELTVAEVSERESQYSFMSFLKTFFVFQRCVTQEMEQQYNIISMTLRISMVLLNSKKSQRWLRKRTFLSILSINLHFSFQIREIGPFVFKEFCNRHNVTFDFVKAQVKYASWCWHEYQYSKVNPLLLLLF